MKNRKILLSCGSNKGGEFLAWKESKVYDPEVLIYAFEPEPRCFPHLKNVMSQVPNITHIKKAISTEDGTQSWNVGKLTVSGTLREDKNWGLTGEKILIETIDFCKWLEENIEEDDYVMITLDIEGSEYEVLQKMFETGAMKYINKMYVEFHGNKMYNKQTSENIEAELKEKLLKTFGEECYFRFVEGNFKMFKQAHPDLDPNMFNNIGTIGK